jgi:hypothetical protein
MVNRLIVTAVTLALGGGLPFVARGGMGDAVIRAPAGKSEIVITTTARLAGAIHSLTWDGTEFINSTDHGRQLQSACSFDNSPSANAETYNPTEAGSRRDHVGPTSTSRLLELQADGNRLRTRTRMAFWLAPGERSEEQLARNSNTLSDYELAKDVRIGCERWPQALDYRVTFTVPTNAVHKSAQFEALTGYLPPEFDTFWQFNPQTRKLESLSDGPGEINNPVVLATADGQQAMGIFAPAQPQENTTGPTYGRWRFTAEQVVKWNCVFRVRDAKPLRSGDYSFRMLVPIGTRAEVEQMLKDWTTSPARVLPPARTRARSVSSRGRRCGGVCRASPRSNVPRRSARGRASGFRPPRPASCRNPHRATGVPGAAAGSTGACR